jgi:hypothetical protein
MHYPHHQPAFGIAAGLLALSLLPSMADAAGAGVLVVRTATWPDKIRPGDKTTLAIDARDGYQRPLAGVSVKITADTGFFETNRKRLVQGATDPRGEFKAVWQSDVGTDPGVQVFTIIASKSGYLGRYPLAAYVTLESSAGTPQGQPHSPNQGATPFSGPTWP